MTQPLLGPRVLVVEDDLRTAAFLERALTRDGYRVELAHAGDDALAMAADAMPDLVVLDLMLPGLDGFEVARRLRSVAPVPILMLTARDGVADRVHGLDAGADDYLAKPFALEELLARVRAQLRRQAIGTTPPRGGVLEYADVRLDLDARTAHRGARQLRLRHLAFELLAYLLRNPERAISRQELFRNVWGSEHLGESNPVDVTVAALRRELDQGEPGVIQTVRGFGYKLSLSA